MNPTGLSNFGGFEKTTGQPTSPVQQNVTGNWGSLDEAIGAKPNTAVNPIPGFANYATETNPYLAAPPVIEQSFGSTNAIEINNSLIGGPEHPQQIVFNDPAIVALNMVREQLGKLASDTQTTVDEIVSTLLCPTEPSSSQTASSPKHNTALRSHSNFNNTKEESHLLENTLNGLALPAEGVFWLAKQTWGLAKAALPETSKPAAARNSEEDQKKQKIASTQKSFYDSLIASAREFALSAAAELQNLMKIVGLEGSSNIIINSLRKLSNVLYSQVHRRGIVEAAEEKAASEKKQAEQVESVKNASVTSSSYLNKKTAYEVSGGGGHYTTAVN